MAKKKVEVGEVRPKLRKGKIMKKLEVKICNESDERIIKLTPEKMEKISAFLYGEGLKQAQVKTISLLAEVSKGKVCFETTLEELASTFYPNYLQMKRENVTKSKKYKTRIRCRLHYFENVWQKKNKKIFFEILSKKCADGCAAAHSKQNPNPDIITIRLNFFLETENQNKNKEITFVKEVISCEA